jgi:hypothetical protein
LLSGADVKSAVRCVTGQDREHGARGSGYRIATFLSDWKAVLSAGLDRHLLVPFGRRHFPVKTLRVVRAAQVNGDGNFQSEPLFCCCSCKRRHDSVAVILKGNQLFFVLTCLRSFELVACCLTNSFNIWNRNKSPGFVPWFPSRYSQSSQNDRIIYFWGDGEAGVYVQNLLTSVLLRTEI